MKTYYSESVICDTADRPKRAVLSTLAGALLILIGVVESAIGGLMFVGLHSVSNLLFLFSALVLLCSAIVSMRDTARRSLLMAQSAAALGVLALLWAGGGGDHRGPSITLGRSTYELTLTLAGLLFMAMLLPRLMRNPAEQTCQCGH